MRTSQLSVAPDMVVLCLKNVHCRPKEFFYADYMWIIFSRAATVKSNQSEIKSNMKGAAGFRQAWVTLSRVAQPPVGAPVPPRKPA
jgi:hypothetical protein